ncbi:hypothetical protein EKO07_03980 [Enterobacter hormaechei subsp. xiangfangensis]|uniref:hypothetical protein n=1 Tax=Enterobacter cloacae complex TaxID=354276 RepID=UPI0008482B1D|nr:MULTISPECIES: hypothetical protein [Enterobacter cloacae complex]ODP91640.1 hypothetical protein A9502_28225 [Klebsiella pneumoniae]QQE37227.1 hypothetical protein I6I13_12420 [Enterobacter asburiae]RTM39737.1 hypothetical protein EKO13_07565 [Enterobacter hormaechei subsp. xiangfangensis]RTM73975.1 hypothetical protein EKO07_03980 [Enterobacter hormaechei subsp. xiangfangensis]VAE11084.1 Uncharacterised protein [Enterobacter hormaechei]
MGMFGGNNQSNRSFNINIIGDTTNQQAQPNTSTNFHADEFWQKIESIITAKVATAYKPKTKKELKDYGDLIVKTGALILISLIIILMLISILWVYVSTAGTDKDIPEFTKTLFTSVSTIVAGIVGFLFGGKKD